MARGGNLRDDLCRPQHAWRRWRGRVVKGCVAEWSKERLIVQFISYASYHSSSIHQEGVKNGGRHCHGAALGLTARTRLPTQLCKAAHARPCTPCGVSCHADSRYKFIRWEHL